MSTEIPEKLGSSFLHRGIGQTAPQQLSKPCHQHKAAVVGQWFRAFCVFIDCEAVTARPVISIYLHTLWLLLSFHSTIQGTLHDWAQSVFLSLGLEENTGHQSILWEHLIKYGLKLGRCLSVLT